MKCEHAENGKGFDMGKLKSNLVWAVSWLTLGSAFYAGFVVDIEGARNVATFAVFALAVLALFSWAPETIKTIAERSATPAWRRSATVFLQGAALGLLVWEGAMLTAIAWLWVSFAGAISAELVRRKRAELELSQ